MSSKENIMRIVCSDPKFYGKRIDRFLGEMFPEYSRTYFQTLITDGNITVNDTVISKSSHILSEQDEIAITFPPPKKFDLTPRKVDFEVVDIQEDFIIINKPAGLVVHHSKEVPDRVTLVHGLLYSFQELEAFSDTDRPGIVHRLDKNTSGLLIIARTVPAQIALSALFKERKIHKTYLAVVKGHPDREGTIEFSVGRHRTMRHKMSHQSYDGRDALSHYDVRAYYNDSSLVEVRPVTGRTHQIRVHLAAIGHGILGDALYGRGSKFIPRQALHAWKLSFTYKGHTYSYSQVPPEDFRTLLSRLVARSPKT